MNIAWRNLARDRARLLITACGVGSAVLLILIVRGLYAGVLDASAAYVRGVDADVWVAQEGAPAELFDSVPLLSGQTGRDIEAVTGVVDTARLVGRAMHLPEAGAAADLFVVGVDADKPWTAPAGVGVGLPVPGIGEIVLDAAVADGLGLGVGATLEFPRGALTISGIARALANDPPLILADEPTANLDSRTGYQAMHMREVRASERDKAVVIVTHDDRIADIADRVYWLEDGTLTDDRPAGAELATDPVCGMKINIERAAGHRAVGTQRYHLCSDLFLDRFDAQPARYST